MTHAQLVASTNQKLAEAVEAGHPFMIDSFEANEADGVMITNKDFGFLMDAEELGLSDSDCATKESTIEALGKLGFPVCLATI